MKRILLLIPLLFAFTGVVGNDPNPLTFWWYAGDPTMLRPALECALERIRAATCLPVDVSFDAHHWVRTKTAAQMGGLAGQTSGPISSLRISLLEGISGGYACNVLTHEIGQHVLRQSSSHAGGYSESNKYKLYEQVVAGICAIHDCQCFNPEP